MVDDALGIAGGSARVVQGDGVPLIRRHPPGEVGIAARQELLVVDAKPRTLDPAFEVPIVDQDRLHFGEFERLADQASELGIDDHDLGVGVIEHKAITAGSSLVLIECSTAPVIGTP